MPPDPIDQSAVAPQANAPAPAIAPNTPTEIPSAAPAAIVNVPKDAAPEGTPQAPAVEGASPASTAGVPETPKDPEAPPSLLDKFDEKQKAPAEVKPGEEKPGEAVKPAEAKPGDKPVEGEAAPAAELAPVEYKYDLPDTLQMSDVQRTEFHGVLDAFRRDPVAGVQGLVDMANKTFGDMAASMRQQQFSAFNEYRSNEVKRVMSDPILGGAGHDTEMHKVARMRDLLVPEAEREDFDKFAKVTGAGDHLAFLRIMHNAAAILDRPPPPPPGAKPPPNNGRAPGKSGRGVLYDHPSSSK